MITLTKEWLLKTIAELEEERDATPGAVNEDAAMSLAAMKLALASLEAKDKIPELRQVIYHFRDWNEGFPVERFKADYVISWMLANYPPAQPTAVSVPGDVSGPLAHAYKELTPTFMRNHIGVFERYGIYPDGSAGIQAMRIALDGMNRRAAMLQGAERVSNRDELPDGWVVCSERMPEGMTDVHISNGHDVGQGWWDGDTWQTQHDYYSVPGDVTHWMSLPAAPQKEDK
ncbi:TPA: DUF551 domain-containing protein [Enterobacter hormaechei subsp. xiangfangensis]|uniref:DUF551 domain-containing protein n=1 Tax=Enterobacter hormaechei TaxID=158836 RepID=UPI0034CF2B88|nr:DUF551 domain-containing protein [Enterobacter hormaechei subsp. xiangfangensis]HCJ6641720.1 DUF551 domain-containing protein [Enterobacter hormaechei subsp. xiangfangensis]HCJ7336643.1 DUF551 domain-containing protein [Enterobacter hormaechei subsp. xiangfangensis]